MIKLKHILFEEDTTDKDNPDKILVKNKESGEEYYINKSSYDPKIHEKPKQSTASTDKTADTTAKSDTNSKQSASKETETPEQKVTNALTPVDFVINTHRDEIVSATEDLRPDLKKKLLNHEFTDFFREYDNAMLGVNSGKPELALKSTKMIVSIAKKIQAVSLAKHSVINTFKLSPELIKSANEYHNNSPAINKLLRDNYGKLKWSPEQIKTMFKKQMSAEELSKLAPVKAIADLDEYFKSDDCKLQYPVTVFRGVKNDVLKPFLSKKRWTDHAFVSTSINPLIAENFSENGNFKPHMRSPLFKIELKVGDPALMLKCEDDEFCVETEVTLPRNCTFVIKAFDAKNNIYELAVEFPNA